MEEKDQNISRVISIQLFVAKEGELCWEKRDYENIFQSVVQMNELHEQKIMSLFKDVRLMA